MDSEVDSEVDSAVDSEVDSAVDSEVDSEVSELPITRRARYLGSSSLMDEQNNRFYAVWIRTRAHMRIYSNRALRGRKQI